MNAQDIISRLQLSPHPEGGWYRRVYEGPVLPGGQKCGSAIYYLLESGDFSAFHRLEQDELLHFYAGSPLRAHLFSGGVYSTALLGPDLLAGQAPQLCVPAGTIYAFAPELPQSFSLIGCSVFPGFTFETFKLYSAAELKGMISGHDGLFEAFTRS